MLPIFLLTVVISSANAHNSGAPNDACSNLKPSHGSPAGGTLYSFTVSATSITVNQELTGKLCLPVYLQCGDMKWDEMVHVWYNRFQFRSMVMTLKASLYKECLTPLARWESLPARLVSHTRTVRAPTQLGHWGEYQHCHYRCSDGINPHTLDGFASVVARPPTLHLMIKVISV